MCILPVGKRETLIDGSVPYGENEGKYDEVATWAASRRRTIVNDGGSFGRAPCQDVDVRPESTRKLFMRMVEV